MLDPKTTSFASVRGRHVSPSHQRRPENVIPMINIVFLLLLYFMVAGNLYIDLEVTPPVSAASTAAPTNVLKIEITAAGQVQYRGSTIAIAQIERELQDDFRGHVVRLSADAQTDTVVVARAIASLSAVGVKQIMLVTLRR